ncbi:MAG: hypothetical protein KAI70_00730 [Candidatus Omnitrophica bacterium]|nr:hypothetical protein [Candidatus Omnitrophota bacterium]
MCKGKSKYECPCCDCEGRLTHGFRNCLGERPEDVCESCYDEKYIMLIDFTNPVLDAQCYGN